MIVSAFLVTMAVVVDSAVGPVENAVFHRMAAAGCAPVSVAAALACAVRSATPFPAGIVACGAVAVAAAATSASVAAAVFLRDECRGGSRRLPD
ncbi:hypothetical protein [Pelagibius sp. 7325]|uniref:hypothetical protein n=1 Tax=Pelagibius sp. 7325 TaxID=3131994 RepID=UPI0030EEECC5